VTSSATTTININSGNVVDLTMASNISTLAFSNVPASGTPLQLVIVFRNNAAGTLYTVAWPSSIYWDSGNADGTLVGPALTPGPNSVTIISLLTTDGGTKWRGWVEATMPGANLNALWVTGSGFLTDNGVTITRSSPVQVGANTNWVQVSSNGNHAIAINASGTMWAWGYNRFWRMGGFNNESRSSPSQIGSNTNWSFVSTSYLGSGALTTTNELYMWGKNDFGQVGNNAVEAYGATFPTLIAPDKKWAVLSLGSYHTTAITTSGQLWAWGSNGDGQLGQNNIVNRSSPVQVGALTTWASVSAGTSCTLGLTTGGTLFSWGRNTDGQLGQNDTAKRSSPVQVGALTTWAFISSSPQIGSSAAITTAGTLFTWGRNGFGQLGQNDIVNRSSPVQVGALTTWAKINAAQSMKAITTAGTLFAWGTNNEGQLGQNDRVNRSSPVQIGALTDWTQVTGGDQATVGLRFGSIINPA
jgi:alpha-tubulin suppressor-like RCC1 family protein